MTWLLRTLAFAVAIAHGAVVVAPCAGLAATAGDHHEAAATHHAGDAGHHETHERADGSRSAASHAPECGEHAKRTPPDAKAPCPCGCDDTPAPGAPGSRVGFALFTDVPEPLAATPARDFLPAAARMPAAPPDRRDPVPV